MEQDAELIRALNEGWAICRAVVIDHGGLLGSLFMAGLLGAGSHCIGMCGPFVLAQTVARLEERPASDMREFHRLSGALLVPYHLGRLTTYVALGAVAGGLAGGVTQAGGLRWLSAALLALAALLFLAYAVRQIGVVLPWLAKGGEGWWQRTIGKGLRPIFERPWGLRGYGLGVALGFLPCGLLYGAVAAAASAGGILEGGFAMTAFALGTIPALVAIGLAGHVAGRQWQGVVARIAPVLLLVNAGVLMVMAWRLVA